MNDETEPTEPTEQAYWQGIEGFLFPLTATKSVVYEFSKAAGYLYCINIVVRDTTNWVFPKQLAATQFIFHSPFGGDHLAIITAREWAQKWLRDTIDESLHSHIAKSLPLVNEGLEL